MRLEIVEFPVKEISFGAKTAYNNGVLQINKAEVLQEILADHRITEAQLDVVYPGENARITNVNDILEPRAKVEGPGCIYPGIMGGVDTVGQGKAHRLSGMTVMVAGHIPTSSVTGTAAPRSCVYDMTGPGAVLSPFANTVNLVLNLKLAQGHPDLDYHWANELAAMKLADRLAKATVNLKPTGVQVFDNTITNNSLPKVLYIQGLLTTAHEPHPSVTFYGFPIREMFPFWVEPSELLEGALVSRALGVPGLIPTTWHYMNNPIVLELYKNHGKEINFLGVILERIRFEVHINKELQARRTALLAKQLGADGMINTWMVAGNAFIDTITTTGECEKLGVKSVLVTYEQPGQYGVDPPLIYTVPNANAIVSTGNKDKPLKLPAVQRVVGEKEFRRDTTPGTPITLAAGEIEYDEQYLVGGAIDLWGWSHSGIREY